MKIMNVAFTWNPKKAIANFRKHGIRFEAAKQVLLDPHRVILEDFMDEAGEFRSQAIGHVGDMLLVFVAYIDRSDENQEVIHIISVRKATAYEKELYAEYSSKA